jgi:hypothetical protein
LKLVFIFLLFLLSACGGYKPDGHSGTGVQPVIPPAPVIINQPPAAAPLLSVNPLHFQSLHLTTYQCPFDIERTLWHDAYLTLTGAFDDIAVRLRGRGNSTWWDGEEKRPLRLRFHEPIYLLGSPYAARDWILLANHLDPSLMRNYAALAFSAMLGQDGRMDYLPTFRHIHLYINGDYKGVYLLTDERDINPGRLALTRHANPAQSDYLIEMDARIDRNGIYGFDYFTVYNTHYALRFPGSSRRTEAHVDYVRDYIMRVSRAIRYQQWEGVLSLIDLGSFVDFYIVQELFKNSDAHNMSVFMTLRGRGDARRLYKGPPWDFDLAAGNRASQAAPHYLYVGLANYWYRNLLEIPQFFAAVTERWNEIKDTKIAEMLALIGDTAQYYRRDFERNFERHPIMGAGFWNTPPQLLEIHDFSGQVAYLITWLETRVNWLDDYFNARTDHLPLWHLLERRNTAHPRSVYLDGELLSLWPPRFVLRNVYRIELYGMADAFGIQAEYDAETQIIILSRGDVQVNHRVYSSYYTLNGEARSFGASSLTVGDYIYLPMEGILSAFGFTLHWDAEARTVAVVSP